MESSNLIQASYRQNVPSNQYNYMWSQTERSSYPPCDAWNSQPLTPVESAPASHMMWQPTWNSYDNFQHLAPSQQNNSLVSSYQTYQKSDQISEHPLNYVQEPAFHRQSYENACSAHVHSYQSRQPYSTDLFNCNYPSYGHPVEEENTRHQQDQELLDGFLANHCKRFESARPKKSKLNINEAQKILTECLALCKALRTIHGELRNTLDTNETSWKKISQESNAIKENLQAALLRLTFTDVQSLKNYIQKRHNKRQRQKRQKQTRHEKKRLNEQHTKNVHEKIDAWQESIRQAHLAAEMERKMKKEADSILSEVRKKRAEANKMLELVKSAARLRSLKKQSAENQGLYTSLESDKKFLKVTSHLEDVLNTRLAEYGEEERTLQVMLDEEQQVTRESAVKQRQQEQKEKLEALKLDKIFCFFGPNDIESDLDPRLPYWKYYTHAERDLDTLIRLRQSWDIWLVPPDTANSSGIPLSWVAPIKPSSEAWASYVDKESSSWILKNN